ncbi:hypothetical protein GUITHDRAFT_69157 [Guillardia theta CCMP2712]|uniref:SET domain-containing protein n=1 Tax=Guillardia theta (strain CCMP2712) TaxID=905079 RepID=L1JI22_GUITC|nr:hypothetical protein GUITHDRAFT_69157 [Guillardia theta CCMP2712]EKX47774.1 hypothetical protein GUITHDRAFT_69157 [Guillardia theta CCMP2712]|eukprot:XP_005834754.1 hypothetical protein GUITHDRAFT_69157 [Guillardia theta CCMP2712]
MPAVRQACRRQFSSFKDNGSKIFCSKVIVKGDNHGGDGAFAACDIKQGELVERGIVRRIPGLDGMKNPYVFTWSDDVPNHVWAIGSGCATFYNTSYDPNTSMKRFFDEDRFEIFAIKDIKEGEELTHTYKSKKWRTCFVDDERLHK